MEAGKSLAQGIEGLADLWRKPVEGARSDGFGGFVPRTRRLHRQRCDAAPPLVSPSFSSRSFLLLSLSLFLSLSHTLSLLSFSLSRLSQMLSFSASFSFIIPPSLD